MHYFACDVAKDSITAALYSRALTARQRFTIDNNIPAITEILRNMKDRGRKLTVGVESTALYHAPLVEACTALDITCLLLNPLLTKEVLRHSIRKRKTDRDDTLVIAKLLAQGEGHPVTTESVKDTHKALVRSARKVSMLTQSLALHVRHTERVLGEVPPPLLEQCGHIRHTKAQMQKLAIAQADPELRKLLESIPGIGAWLATVILAETQNFSRLRSGDALVAAAGLDPRVKQSGVSLDSHGKLTKRGSPHLRWALGCAANVAIRRDPEFRSYYEKKRAEGKRFRTALCATSRKMAYRVFAVAKRRTPYLPASVT